MKKQMEKSNKQSIELESNRDKMSSEIKCTPDPVGCGISHANVSALLSSTGLVISTVFAIAESEKQNKHNNDVGDKKITSSEALAVRRKMLENRQEKSKQSSLEK